MSVQVPYPAIGSKWREFDRRVNRTVQIVRYDSATGRVRIYCVETEQLSWAKAERFNGKSGGYARLVEGPSSLPRRTTRKKKPIPRQR